MEARQLSTPPPATPTPIPTPSSKEMFLERATRVYRSFRTEYLKLLGFFLALALGPWVGVQGFVYWNVNREQDPPFELPNGCLCLVLYVLTLFMISNTGKKKREKGKEEIFVLL